MQHSTIEFSPTRVRSLGWWSPVLLVVAAFAIRVALFGNPLIHIDEGFYLLVGDGLWHGRLPYVDVWDRKPIGLFLIYAAIRLLGGDGVIQYQVVATLFAALTAIVIARMAVRMTSRVAATVAGVLYVMMLSIAGGHGGQAPVFYNLFVALAASVLLSLALDRSVAANKILRRGCGVMALIGVSLQIKYSAVFEGAFFGLILLMLLWRSDRRPIRLLAAGLLWSLTALAPTIATGLLYAANGYGDSFLYANFLSIQDRRPEPFGVEMARLGESLELLVAPALCIGMAVAFRSWRNRRAFTFAVAWLAAAATGWLAFGTFFDHYILPLLVPLSLTMAPAFAVRRWHAGPTAAAVLIIAGAVATGVALTRIVDREGSATQAYAIAAAFRSVEGRCPWVYRGSPIFYLLSNACTPTAYPFAPHLILFREQGAIGIAQADEVRRILASAPPVILDTRETWNDHDRQDVDRLVQSVLASAYRIERTERIEDRTLTVWRLQRPLNRREIDLIRHAPLAVQDGERR